MIDRTNRWLLGTAAFLLVLTGLRIWQLERPAEAVWTVPAAAPDRVAGIEVRRGESSVALRRGEDGWQLQGAEGSVDEAKVGLVLRDWTDGFAPDLRVGQARDDEARARYGLDVASRLEVILDGQPRRELWIGKALPGGSHFVCPPGSAEVFRGRVPGAFRFDPEPAGWRDVRPLPFEADDLLAIGLLRGDVQTRFRRIDDARRRWVADRPTGFSASSQAIQAMARSLGAIKPLKVEDAGPLPPGARPLVVEAETEAGRWTLRFGAGAGDGVWAQVDGDPRRLLLPAATRGIFDKDLDALADRTVVSFVRRPQTRILLQRGERQVVVVPEGERGWRVESPADLVVESQELQLAANSLLNLQARELLREPPPLPDEPTIITVLGPGEAQVLRIDPSRPDGPFPASVDGRSDGFVLRTRVAQRLLALLAD